MQPHLAYRVGRTLTGLATVTALALGACKSSTAPGITTPTGVYKGTIVGSAVSGVLTITFPAAAAAPIPNSVQYSAMGSEAGPPTGTLKLQGSGTTITLTGTYDAVHDTLKLSGGTPSYAFVGVYASNKFYGTFTGPNGGGQFAALGGTQVTVFCGAYSGSATGYWNLVLGGTTLSGLATESNGPIHLDGTYTSGATPNNAIITIGSPPIGTAQGNLDTGAGTGSGTWNVTSGGSGNWTTSATCL
jgi:hypothetical protein